MIRAGFSEDNRQNLIVKHQADLVVVGGGMSGVCCAITAARAGIKVILIQDRPVLGGNASSEVRLWILGATSHMGNNNRWAREGGVIDEILIENLYRNKEGNPIIFDTILLEKVNQEQNITLLLNTAVYDVEKSGSRTIKKLKAFCSQNSTEYHVASNLFCDASGDGIVAFKAGAAFRMGAESKEEFGELFAPDKAYGELLGHTMYFYSKKVDSPVAYTPPAFALDDIKKLPKFKVISSKEFGCRFWWIEYGGNHDTVHDTELIKWELWKVVYGVWDYIKNSGEFEDVDNLTLEWVATIPGKRESRRFEGEYILKQQDIVNQVSFEDAIAFGGWAIDLHPSDGVYSNLPSCEQYHAKGVYQLPYRCYISKDINNLFYAGRIISATHVAFGSSRVMATCAHGAQAVGMAAALCTQKNILPNDVLKKGLIGELQQKLNATGQSIPGIPHDISDNLVAQTDIRLSSYTSLSTISGNGKWLSLNQSAAQMLPLKKEVKYEFELNFKAEKATCLNCELRTSSKPLNHTPDETLECQSIELKEGEQKVKIAFDKSLNEDKYAFILFQKNDLVSVEISDYRQTGLLSVFNKKNLAVSNHGAQTPPENTGFDSFEFWTPERRPKGHNMAMEINPPVKGFGKDALLNGYTRPTNTGNAWVAALTDENPEIELSWNEVKTIKEIQLHFDPDFDHPLESSLQGHPESVIPFVVRNYKIKNLNNEVIYESVNNHQTINKVKFTNPISTAGLKIELEHPSKNVPAALFHLQVF
ncbi:FAD-dependent oxidoreductase [Flexithrix dorotheae]|uniref:FAD-dependent oxidoreductase n=1 Tax=Flexithrix dorotheae TaxID=70993 RepID=UPI000373DEAB|nr:FAD-dependent oxidoreductase [Flexithrix dorotheae]